MKKVTLAQAAEILGVSIEMIRTWEKKKLIQSEKFKHNIRVFDLELLQNIHNNCLSNPTEDRGFRVLKTDQKSNFTTLELFAGCGGMALGLENAGLINRLMVEIDKDCVNTLLMNRPQWNVIKEDVTQMDFTPYQGAIDIVSGGFPCQAFSYAGLGKGFADTRGTLFFEFARCLSEVQPKLFIAENVRGLLSHDKGRTFSTILKVLDDLGYQVSYQVVSAQFLDVPQKRERVILIGSQKSLNLHPLFPKEKPYTISLREGLKDCPPSVGVEYNARKKSIMELVPPGGNWRDLPLEIQKQYMKNSWHNEGGRTGFAKRLNWDEPCLTITCSPAQTQTERCHPSETRPLTIREYARVQTFPDDWQFSGSLSAQYKQIGNAVPVNMAYHLGRCLRAMLEGKINQNTMLKVSQNTRETIQQLSIPGLSF